MRKRGGRAQEPAGIHEPKPSKCALGIGDAIQPVNATKWDCIRRAVVAAAAVARPEQAQRKPKNLFDGDTCKVRSTSLA